MIRLRTEVKVTKLKGLSKEDIEDTLEKAAILVEGEARRLCPVDTGRLQKSITHRKVSPTEQIIIASTDYAEYVEYGTTRMKVGTPEEPYVYTSRSGKYPSYRPFLRTALYQNTNRIIRMFEQIDIDG
jgi:HK97 gp10 family phage protein